MHVQSELEPLPSSSPSLSSELVSLVEATVLVSPVEATVVVLVEVDDPSSSPGNRAVDPEVTLFSKLYVLIVRSVSQYNAYWFSWMFVNVTHAGAATLILNMATSISNIRETALFKRIKTKGIICL